MKQTIYEYIKEHTNEKLEAPNQAAKVAEDLHVSRNLASGYLNELHSEGKLVKINSRCSFSTGRSWRRAAGWNLASWSSAHWRN